MLTPSESASLRIASDLDAALEKVMEPPALLVCPCCGARSFKPEHGVLFCYGGRRVHSAARMVEARS